MSDIKNIGIHTSGWPFAGDLKISSLGHHLWLNHAVLLDLCSNVESFDFGCYLLSLCMRRACMSACYLAMSACYLALKPKTVIFFQVKRWGFVISISKAQDQLNRSHSWFLCHVLCLTFSCLVHPRNNPILRSLFGISLQPRRLVS